jgi:hypothetical protein
MRQEKLYKKPSSIVNSIQKRCLNKGKFTTATTLIKKSLQQTLVISKKSNPHLEMQRTLSSKRNRGYLSSIVVASGNASNLILERIHLQNIN